jgi:hypothetical protein
MLRHDNIDQHEHALVNEFKGNLFEFLTAKSLIADDEVYLDFIKSIAPSYLNLLSEYESELRLFDDHLVSQLPSLAELTAQKITKHINSRPLKVRLMGKVSKDQKTEEDLVVTNSKQENFKISLKLCKKNSFVNTKSGGLKSFLKKYFQLSDLKQNEFNEKCEFLFEQFTRKLHQEHDLDYVEGFKNWTDQGYPELPGKLKGKSKQLLLDYYLEIKTLLFDEISKIQENEFEIFIKGLLQLSGFSSSRMVQVLCFHSGTDKKHHFDQIIVKEIGSITSTHQKFELMNSNDHSSFYVQMLDQVLQIRIKPMNKFTTSAFKINCSIKFVN